MPAGWVNAVAGKISVTTLDGQKVLQKAPDETIFKRIRAFIGPTDWSNYTFEADVRATTRRRQMGDVGHHRPALLARPVRHLAAAEDRGVGAGDGAHGGRAFAWKPDTWYHLKLRVENLPNGAVRAQGKAWPAGEPEPAAWTIEKVDPIGNREGAPGPLHRRAVRRVSRQLQDDGEPASTAGSGRQQAST